MNRLRFLIKAIRAIRAGRLGDGAAYKAVALTAPAYPATAQQLDRLAQPFPTIELSALRTLPPGSFGRAYAGFMDGHALRPLLLSPEVAVELGPQNPVAVRYPLLHDAFHVLLGFDTGLPGELGVWSFVGAQRYTPTFQRAATFARFAYALAAPSSRVALRHARLRGEQMGRAAPCLIAQPIEDWWSTPLLQVRQALGLDHDC